MGASGHSLLQGGSRHPSLRPKDTVTSPWKSMASTTASAASWMDTSSSSPTVGNQGPTAASGPHCPAPRSPLPARWLQRQMGSRPAGGGGGGAAGRPPDRMMGSTSSYSRRAQIKSRARSCQSDVQGQRPPVTAHRRASPLQPRSLPLGIGRPAVPQVPPPEELRATSVTLSQTGTYRAPARMGAAWTPTPFQAPSCLPMASMAAPGDVLRDSRAPLWHQPVSR